MQAVDQTAKVGAQLVAALQQQNWEALKLCFAPETQFRALTPNGLREAADAERAAGYFARWFGDADELILLDSSVQEIKDRIAIQYYFRAHEDQWYLVEQQAYCDVVGDRIERMDLLCTGFLPEGSG